MLATVFTKSVRDRWRGMAIAVAALAVMLLLAMAVYASFDFSIYDDLPGKRRGRQSLHRGAVRNVRSVHPGRSCDINGIVVYRR